jgi:hypothetical protein
LHSSRGEAAVLLENLSLNGACVLFPIPVTDSYADILRTDPVVASPVRTPVQQFVPYPLHSLVKHLDASEVEHYSVVGIVPLKLYGEYLVLFFPGFIPGYYLPFTPIGRNKGLIYEINTTIKRNYERKNGRRYFKAGPEGNVFRLVSVETAGFQTGQD